MRHGDQQSPSVNGENGTQQVGDIIFLSVIVGVELVACTHVMGYGTRKGIVDTVLIRKRD